MEISSICYNLTRNEEKNMQMYEYYRMLAKSMLQIARSCVYITPAFLDRHDSRKAKLNKIRDNIANLIDDVDIVNKRD